VAAGAGLLAMALGGARASSAEMQTTTTTYQRNADGALTAVTTQVGAQTPTTVYLTWDNFVPSTADPTDGTVASGNGNLLGFGPTPGDAYVTQFSFDQRDRLLTAAAAGAQSVSYTYYPASLMATSTLASNDALDFYYNAGELPRVANIMQGSTQTWSSYLGNATYLSDGSEQVRSQPRKDVAGIYDPAQQTFTPQRYEPYGASPAGVATGPAAGEPAYDMNQNPFLYAGEYADPAWGGYYLRSRWYLAAYETFLGRDPGNAVQRYGYSQGNPVTHTDPSGLRSGYGAFSRKVNRFLRPFDTGLKGELLPLVPVWGQLVGGVQLIGNLPEVWHHPNARTWASFFFLVASVAVEAGDSTTAIDRAYGPLKAFGGRIAADLGIGVGQTILVGYRGHDKWDVPAMIQSISYNASGILWGRLGAGFGYRSHPLAADDVETMFADHLQNGQDGEALVFKVRQATGGSSFLSRSAGDESMNSTLPALDAKRIGMFHEGLLAVSRRNVWFTEVGAPPNEDWLYLMTYWDKFRNAPGSEVDPTEFLSAAQGGDIESRFQYAGKYRVRDVERGMTSTFGAAERRRYNADVSGGVGTDLRYSLFHNNCQDHVARILGVIRNP
jgi:RHS repeat-associated protein